MDNQENSLAKGFEELLELAESEKFSFAYQLPPHLWNSTEWEQLEQKRVESLFLPFIKRNVERAVKKTRLYEAAYPAKLPKLDSIEDFHHYPILVKDSTVKSLGFREKVRSDPYALLPTDLNCETMIYKSGGSMGVATPTFITSLDRTIESMAFSRAMTYQGIKNGSVVYSTYNPTHKGGEETKEAALIKGCIFIAKRTTDTALDAIATMRDYKARAMVGSQGPINEGDKASKSGGTSLLNLIEAGHDCIEGLESVLLGGFKLVPDVVNWSETTSRNVVTMLGSTEALPQATSTLGGSDLRKCKYNSMHLLPGPHYLEVVKEESGVTVPVKRGETGLLIYTTVARQGTPYIRYAPGDQAHLLAYAGECDCGLKTPIISEVERVDNPQEIVGTGCCVG